MKKTSNVKKGLATAVAFAVLSSISMGQVSAYTSGAEENTVYTQTNKLLEVQKADKQSPEVQESTMKLFSDFKLYVKQGGQPEKTMEFKVENEHDMYLALGEVYKQAPSKITIKSEKLTAQMLQSLYRKTKDSYKDPNKTPYIHALLNYEEKKATKTLILVDNSTPYNDEKRELQDLIKGFELTTDFLAEELKGETVEESMVNLSSFIYDNFKYNANGWNFMTISNMPNQEMACQGIAFLSKTVFEKMGYKAETRLGYSHYWVAVEHNGNPITFDPTTDIVLKEKHKTLGLSTKEHIEATSSIGFYSAEFEYNKYREIFNYKFKSKDATKTISKNMSPFLIKEEVVKPSKPQVEVKPDKPQVEIKPTEPNSDKKSNYTDIEKHHSKESVKALEDLGYLKHFSENKFSPNKAITRGEFSQIIAYALHMNEEYISTTQFKDLVGHDSMKSVEYLKSRGIITGKTANTFEPDSLLTRQQAAAILARTMEEIGVKPEASTVYKPYKDEKKISEYARKYVQKTSKAKIFNGDENGNFKPSSTLTRGQASVVVWNLIKGYVK